MFAGTDRKKTAECVKQPRNSSSLESTGLYPRDRKPDSPLMNLSLGILLQAFRDVVSPKKTSHKKWLLWREDALDWFASDKNDPGSFQWVCEVLEISQKDLREWVQAYLLSDEERQKVMAQKLTRFQIRH